MFKKSKIVILIFVVVVLFSFQRSSRLEYFIQNKIISDDDKILLIVKNNSKFKYAIPIEEDFYFTNYQYITSSGLTKWNKIQVRTDKDSVTNLLVKTSSGDYTFEEQKKRLLQLKFKFYVVQPQDSIKIELPFSFDSKYFVPLFSYHFKKGEKYFLKLDYKPAEMQYTQKSIDSLKNLDIKIYDKTIVSNKVELFCE